MARWVVLAFAELVPCPCSCACDFELLRHEGHRRRRYHRRPRHRGSWGRSIAYHSTCFHWYPSTYPSCPAVDVSPGPHLYHASRVGHLELSANPSQFGNLQTLKAMSYSFLTHRPNQNEIHKSSKSKKSESDSSAPAATATIDIFSFQGSQQASRTILFSRPQTGKAEWD